MLLLVFLSIEKYYKGDMFHVLVDFVPFQHCYYLFESLFGGGSDK